MAFCSTEYFDTIASVQKSIHEREKRRHELEEELFVYLRSEERLAKLKCVKLRHYHKDLCKREQQAKARNLELLRRVESLVSNVKEFSNDHSALHQFKLKCRPDITRLLEEGRKWEREEQLDASKESSTSILPSMGRSYPPATIVTGQPAPCGSLAEYGILSACSSSLTGPTPNHPPVPQPLRDPLTDAPASGTSCVVALSDFPDSDGSAILAGVMRVPSAGGPFMERDHGPGQPARPHRTSQASGASSHNGSVSGLSLQHHPWSPSPDAHLSPDPAQHGSGEPASSAGRGEEVDTESTQNYPDIPEQGQNGSPSTSITPRSNLAESPDSSLNPASNMSVSPSDGAHEARSTRGGAPASARDDIPSKRTPEDIVQPPSPALEQRLSLEGFFNLLDSIEGHLPARDAGLYSSPAVSEQNLRDIISRSQGHGGLRGEELAAGGTVVLRQLPCLARAMAHGCLLPSHLVHTHWATAADAAQIQSCLFGDSALLWERWFTHLLRLLRWEVLPLERAVQLFTPLLVCDGASYTDKAEVLLKRLLTQAAEAGLPSESEASSSCSLPSLLHDGLEIKPDTRSKNPASQGVQSGEEDSADQSPVESIPIRETKAYQLLKQSVTQEKPWRSRQEEGTSDLEQSGESDIEKPKREGLVHDLRKNSKKNVQVFSAVQSKAFWGDSDDTNSEIEMALQPQSHNTNNDDFDDFYD